MNAAFQAAQSEWDNRQPVELPGDEAEKAWIDNASADLLRGADVTFKRCGHQAQGVTFERFAEELDQFIAERLQAPGMSSTVLARLVWAARHAPSEAAAPAEELLGDFPDDAEREVARKLLAPLTADGVTAEAEDAGP